MTMGLQALLKLRCATYWLRAKLSPFWLAVWYLIFVCCRQATITPFCLGGNRHSCMGPNGTAVLRRLSNTGTDHFYARTLTLLLQVQLKIADLEAQVATLSVQSHAMDEERTSFNSRINALTGTLAVRDQQLMDVNSQLAQVGSFLPQS